MQERSIRKGIIELMTHPGQPYSVEEAILLNADWVSSLPCFVELINYNDI